jgi:transposase
VWLAVGVRDNDGRKLDHFTLEQLRLRTVAQIAARETTCAQAAKALGLSEAAVYRWWQHYRQGGEQALRGTVAPGPQRRLSEPQLNELYDLIRDHEPRDHGLSGALWTRDLVKALIKTRFRVEVDRSTVGRTLRAIGLSVQRPAHRAIEADPAKVREWEQVTWPALRTEADRTGAMIFFADEAGARSDHRTGTTWAPVGRTPVVKATGQRTHVNMITAVPLKGTLRFNVFTSSFTSRVFLDFLKRLIRDVEQPIIMVVDNLRVHHAKAVTTWLNQVNAKTPGRIRLVFLPPYSPQLNPAEWVWQNVKTNKIGKARPTNARDLPDLAFSALRSLQKLPATVAGFFRDPHLAYLTASPA